MRAGATHCPPSSSPSPSRSPSPHLPSATAAPSSSPHPSRPLPHLHLHSCPRTRTLTLTSLHCARRCRLLGASVGALSSLCDAAVSGAHRARLLCARRGYMVGRSRSAALLVALLWSTSGPKVSAGACAGGSRLINPGRRAGHSARETAAGRAVRAAPPDAPPSIARRASLPRRGLGAASSAVPTPRVVPGPAQAVHE